MKPTLNTIDRCFRDAQEILGAAENGGGRIAKTYSIFTSLQPILAESFFDDRLAIVALAIWKARAKSIKTTTDFRKGVRDMNRDTESLQVRAGSKTYFFDRKETKDGKPYLVITESRFMGEDKERERVSMVIFQEHADEFSKAVSEMATKLAK